MQAEPSSAPASAAGARIGRGGMAQPVRVACFALAFIAFAVATYFAVFRVRFPAPGDAASGLAGLSWFGRPIEFNPGSRLHRVSPGVDLNCISALVGGGHIWIGGTQGLLIHSADEGQTWEQLPVIGRATVTIPQNAQPTAPPAKAALRRDPTEESEIIRVAAQEQPSNAQQPRPQQQPLANPAQQAFPNAPAGMQEQRPMNQAAQAPNAAQTQPPATPIPTPLFTPPPVPLPAVPSLISNHLIDLQFVTAAVGYAVTAGGEVLATNDGGMTWRLVRPVDLSVGFPVRVRFADERRGVMVGQFGVSATYDGGETWSIPSAAPSRVSDVVLMNGLNGHGVGLFADIVQIAESDPNSSPPILGVRPSGSVRISGRQAIAGLPDGNSQFTRIARAGPQTIFACGNRGEIVRSSNGGAWQALRSGMTESLNGLFFVSDRVGWAISTSGKIIATSDRGETWQPETSRTTAELCDIYFASETRGIAAGRNGTLIGTDDGGRTWRPIVTASDTASSGRYFWLPAPWYFAVVLVLFGLVRKIPDEVAPPPQAGIGQLLISDKPLSEGDRDYLGFQEVAWGLSNYLRNKATKPPLTVAITGEWGMGKSSLMNLLASDLQHYKFRPVWFNAWHHQTEEHLLAALLENIRKQAIPPVTTPEGVVFHAKLLWLRARTHPFVAMLLVGAICFAIGFFTEGRSVGQSYEALIKLLASDELRKEIEKKSSQIVRGLIALASVAVSIITFVKGFQPFGTNPASLLASKSNSANASALRAQTSFRHRFATEFREVTESLNPLSMVVFVDDLDRCRPEQVYDMLESINFLVSCGDCIVVMGLARRRVERCVGLVFDKVAAEGPDVVGEKKLSRADKRRRFARQYLEKLINIEVPVPKGEPNQIRTLLVGRKAEATPPKRWIVVGEKVVGFLPHLLPIVLCIIGAVAALSLSHMVFKRGSAHPERTNVTATPSPTPTATASLASTITPTPTAAPAPTAPQIGNAIFSRGQKAATPVSALLLLSGIILTIGIIRLSRRSGSVVEDSPAFVAALEQWFPFLGIGSEMTPRAVKRFVNRVRYFAMMEGSFRAAPRWWERLGETFASHARKEEVAPAVLPSKTDEDVLVALATVHEKHPDWFNDDFASFRAAAFTRQAHLPPEFQSLRIDEATFEHFQKLVAGVEVR